MQGANALSTVPFVGCSGDGVLGQTGASTGKSLIIGIPQNVALKLAIYADSQGHLAVLAPRGWTCTSHMGNSSAELDIFADSKIPSGPAVTISLEGIAGGRYWASYFPKLYPQPVEPVAAKYPDDLLHYEAPNIVEYITPARHAGLGFDYWGFSENNGLTQKGIALLPSLPSYGLLAVNAGPDTGGFILSVRLPQNDSFLRKAIVNFYARCMNGRANVQCESGGAFVADGSTTPQ
jgi:hypothetical protein